MLTVPNLAGSIAQEAYHVETLEPLYPHCDSHIQHYSHFEVLHEKKMMETAKFEKKKNPQFRRAVFLLA